MVNDSSCSRCGKSKKNLDQICEKCKSELVSRYDNYIDWETAYQIELEQDAGKDIIIDF